MRRTPTSYSIFMKCSFWVAIVVVHCCCCCCSILSGVTNAFVVEQRPTTAQQRLQKLQQRPTLLASSITAKPQQQQRQHHDLYKLYASGLQSDDNDDRSNSSSISSKKKKGYQFGDITRSIFKGGSQVASQSVNTLTGKNEYEFGDLTRWLTSQGVAENLTTNGTTKGYQFGDLSRFVALEMQAKVANFTGKMDDDGNGNSTETANYNYQMGDISKAVIRRVQSGEYTVDDVWLAMRILLSAGLAVFTPVAAALPTKLLLELINLGLAQEVTGRLLSVLANVVDERMKKALTGNDKYAIGDISKKKLEQGITKFTGKESYQVGDITQAIQKLQASASAQKKSTTTSDKRLILSSDALSAVGKLDPKSK
mmetsp:Transcript_2622/g.3499  ORF Transcript_2622/g.3499 Transcript_2622/m.3499 type:complete len:368 (-) Transcript_2622:75-1178(-)